MKTSSFFCLFVALTSLDTWVFDQRATIDVMNLGSVFLSNLQWKHVHLYPDIYIEVTQQPVSEKKEYEIDSWSSMLCCLR